MDKDKIQSIAEEIADEDFGQEFYDLSDKQQDRVYRKAMQRLTDMLADRADMMRKNEADGGIIRAGFAEGTDNMKMASVDDPFFRSGEEDDHSMRMFGKPYKELNADELEEFREEMMRLMNKFSGGENNRVRELLLKEETEGLSEDEKEELRQLIKTISAQGPMSSNQEGIMMAKKGGRVLKQTGGITETRQLPPEFLEAAQKTFLADLTRQAGLPTVTTATTQQPGETAEQFAARQAQAQQFGITKAGMAGVAPQVAAETQLQQDARGLASGLGSFQPFLTKATTAADAMTPLTGTGAGTGAGSIASYQSPYQQQVIDATLTEFDRQAQIRANQNAAATLGVPGAFGGGREGVQLAEYQASSDRNRAGIQAGLLQQGFQNAAARRQQDLANQQAISTQQRGLGAAAQDFTRAQISGLGTLGSAQQAQQQAILDAQRQAAQMAVDDPRRRLGLLGTGITSITPGAGGVTLQDAPMAAQASPLSQALGFGLMGADIYGRIIN
jgi:hypothetical protein